MDILRAYPAAQPGQTAETDWVLVLSDGRLTAVKGSDITPDGWRWCTSPVGWTIAGPGQLWPELQTELRDCKA